VRGEISASGLQPGAFHMPFCSALGRMEAVSGAEPIKIRSKAGVYRTGFSYPDKNVCALCRQIATFFVFLTKGSANFIKGNKKNNSSLLHLDAR
jgi:hypothetical protein